LPKVLGKRLQTYRFIKVYDPPIKPPHDKIFADIEVELSKKETSNG
jgi:hypothetical protein